MSSVATTAGVLPLSQAPPVVEKLIWFVASPKLSAVEMVTPPPKAYFAPSTILVDSVSNSVGIPTSIVSALPVFENVGAVLSVGVTSPSAFSRMRRAISSSSHRDL